MNTISSVQQHRLFDPTSMNGEAIAEFIEEITMDQDWLEVFHQDLGGERHPIFKPISSCRLMIANIILDVLTEKGMEILTDGGGSNEPHRWV